MPRYPGLDTSVLSCLRRDRWGAGPIQNLSCKGRLGEDAVMVQK